MIPSSEVVSIKEMQEEETKEKDKVKMSNLSQIMKKPAMQEKC